MLATIAQLYVNVLEPMFFYGLILLVVLFVLYMVNLLRGGGKKDDLVSKVVNGFVALIIKIIKLCGRMMAGSIKVLLKAITLLTATVRDFFGSKI